MKTDLSLYNNSWYKPGNAFKRVVWYLIDLIFFKNRFNPFSYIKVLLLRLFGADIGKGVVIKPGASVKYPWFLSVDDYSWIGEGVWIDNLTHVNIGKHTCLSQGAYILTGNHNYKKSTFDLMVSPVNLEDGVWIGAKAIVCPGITCASHAILTAGSVATHSLDPYSIYQGNPAQKIRERRFDKK